MKQLSLTPMFMNGIMPWVDQPMRQVQKHMADITNQVMFVNIDMVNCERHHKHTKTL